MEPWPIERSMKNDSLPINHDEFPACKPLNKNRGITDGRLWQIPIHST